MQRLKPQTGMHCQPPPDSLMNKITKLTRVEDQKAPPPRVDPDEESKTDSRNFPVQSRQLHHQKQQGENKPKN